MSNSPNHFTKVDYLNWNPLSLDEVITLLTNLEIPWAIAGGYAIELFVGSSFRSHSDIDILIERKDQLRLQEYLSSWQLYRAALPGLTYWEQGEFLQGKYKDIWARPDAKSPWRLQIMLFDTERSSWIFKRDPSIRGELVHMWKSHEKGIYYLAPEIQLLYKAKTEIIEKDQLDFDKAAPLLDANAKKWLLSCLQKRFPEGHLWIQLLEV